MRNKYKMGKDGKYVGCKVHDAEDDVLKLYKIHVVLKNPFRYTHFDFI